MTVEPVAFDSFRQPRQVLSCFIVEKQVVIRIVDSKPRSHLVLNVRHDGFGLGVIALLQ